jgi:hypothetical protein
MSPRHWTVGSHTCRSSKIDALRSFETSGTDYRVDESPRFYFVVSSATQQLRLVLVKSGITVSQMQSAVPCALGVRVAPHGDNRLRLLLCVEPNAACICCCLGRAVDRFGAMVKW